MNETTLKERYPLINLQSRMLRSVTRYPDGCTVLVTFPSLTRDHEIQRDGYWEDIE